MMNDLSKINKILIICLIIILSYILLSPGYSFSEEININKLPLKPKDYLIHKGCIKTRSFNYIVGVIVRDLDNDGKKEILLVYYTIPEERNIMNRILYAYHYDNGNFHEVAQTPMDTSIYDAKIARLDGKAEYIVTTTQKEKFRIYKYNDNKLKLIHKQDFDTYGIFIGGVGDFDGDGKEEFILKNSLGKFFKWKDNRLVLWKKYPLQAGFITGNFIGADRDQIVSVIYKGQRKRIYRLFIIKNGNVKVLWKRKLPDKSITPSGNPGQRKIDYNRDGKDDIFYSVYVGKGRNACKILADFVPVGKGYKPKIIKSVSEILSEYYILFHKADLKGNNKRTAIRFYPDNYKERKAKTFYPIIAFYRKGSPVFYRCQFPKCYTLKGNKYNSPCTVEGAGDIDNDGRDEIFVYNTKDEKIDVYGLNPKYY